MRFQKKHLGALTAVAVAAAAVAGTLIQLSAPVVVSQSDAANNAYKAKMGWIAYKSSLAAPGYDVKAQLLVYADGPANAQDIYVARSTDNGLTWTEQKITNSGGATLTIGSDTFTVTHNKPNIFVAPLGVIGSAHANAGADALITYTSSDCENSPAQKVNPNLDSGPQPFMCLWAARSLDGGQTWNAERLTDGSLDPDEDVPAGYVSYKAAANANGFSEAGGFGISFQADPAGLQQGDAEGSGDGASGAKVSPGTNIWYTRLSKDAFDQGTAFPAPVQITDNNATTDGSPGASRANLAISGGTAVLAYEETKAGGAKQIVLHSFPYATPPTDDAGTVISDDANARRVRFVLQGNEAIGDADTDGDAADGDTVGVHLLMLWRGSTTTEAAAPADVIVRRGIKNTTLRPGSTGFLASDVLADTPVNLSSTGSGDNSLAQRALLRGEFAALGYDHTPDAVAANPERTSPPTATYNLYLKRSTDGGASWSAARNLSQLTDPSVRVVEPRLVGTAGTIKLPDGSATGDASDTQNKNVFYVGWGTETNAVATVPLDIRFTRTTDQGANYERVQLLADGPTEQSEAQLRTPPDGNTLGALWMQRDAGTGTVDVVYRNGAVSTVADPDLVLGTTATSFRAYTAGQLNVTVENTGAGDARQVVLSGTAPAGLNVTGSSDGTPCTVTGQAFNCTVSEIAAGQQRTIALTLASTTAGSYALPVSVSGDVVDANSADNSATASVTVTPDDGGGCSAASGDRPVDPVLPALGLLGLIGLALRRMRRR